MTIAVKIILLEDEQDPHTPAIDLSVIYASTRQPVERVVDILSPARREAVVYITKTNDFRISWRNP